MKAIEIKNKGEAARLEQVERPQPIPKSGEILIRVEYAGVNRPDLLQAAGRYEPPPGVTDIPGLEIAGIVEKDGQTFKAGDRVCALVAGGGYTEYCAVPEGQVLPVPRGLSMAEAACIPETFFTVWTNVFERGNLKPGESLLVHGGTSGIGTTAIQLARALGSTVYATAGSDDKCGACEKLGAVAINYKTDNFVERIASLTQGRGVDVILDMVGGDYVPRNLEALAVNGRHVSIAVQGGRTATIDFLRIMTRRLTLTGSTLRAETTDEKSRLAGAVKKHIWPLFESGKIRPVVFETLPLARAQDAHAILKNGRHVGKVALKV